ncbi:MAG: hypothetical protein GY716_05355, partial [bacterium]|nr:hypothetical protein [bacterium]
MKLLRLVGLSCVLFLSLALPSRADVWVAPPPEGSNVTGNGTFSAPWATLQSAYNRVTTVGETIRVKKGTYNECVLAVGAFVGPDDKWVSYIADDPDNTQTKIRGTGGCTPITLGGSGATTLKGFTIENGDDSGVIAYGSVIIEDNRVIGNTAAFQGGGIYSSSRTCNYGDISLVIRDNLVQNNTATSGDGGGIYVNAGEDQGNCQNGDVTVLVDNNTVHNNTAGDDAGGISIEGNSLAGWTTTVTATDNVMTSNDATGDGGMGGGGRFFSFGKGTEDFVIRGNSASNNTSHRNGAGFAAWLEPVGNADHSMLVENNTLTNNTANLGDGGGLDIYVTAQDLPDGVVSGASQRLSMIVRGNHMEGNRAIGDFVGGGGMVANFETENTVTSNFGLAEFIVDANTIVNNTSDLSGGGAVLWVNSNVDDSDPLGCLLVSNPASARMDVSNLLVVDNAASSGTGSALAGGVLVFVRACRDSDSDIFLDVSTIADNTAETGAGGIHLSHLALLGGAADLTLTNSIVAYNNRYGIGGNNPGAANFDVAFGYNDFYSNSFGNYESWIGNQTGSNGNISINPQFENRAAGDYHLSASSPLIDAGDPTPSNLPAEDFEGDEREIDGDGNSSVIVDIGCDEFNVCDDPDDDGFGGGGPGELCPVDNCFNDYNPSQFDCDLDGNGDPCDVDTVDGDGDGFALGCDTNDNSTSECLDGDADLCDDCSSGVWAPGNDGTDSDGDGLCDLGDPDDDNDGVLDGNDSAPLDPFVCSDVDNDTCDDCSSGTYDPSDDGTDNDGDGVCNAGDSANNNGNVCRDDDADMCDDCANGSYDPNDDGTDTDSDGICDLGDNCPTVSNLDQTDTDAAGALAQWASSAFASSEFDTGDYSANQATGAPDSGGVCADGPTNWSPADPVSTPEFLELGYATPVQATGVSVHEALESGFVTSIELRDFSGSLQTIWSGTDNTACGDVFSPTWNSTPYLVTGVRVNTQAPNWEEVDAVELLGVSTDLAGDACDNCPAVLNPGLVDTDNDGDGNACDDDDDNDTVLDDDDTDPVDPSVCQDLDDDDCDDCSQQATVLSFGFDSDADGFTYQDDAFRGTNQPTYAAGDYVAAGGFSGGGLRVNVGGVNGTDILFMSGGWSTTLDLAAATDVQVSFRYRLFLPGVYEADEEGEVLFSVDGLLVGTDPDDFVAQLVGPGGGGPDQTTGWMQFQADLGALSSGQHDFILGGYNNKKTTADEITEILIDDVVFTLGGTASGPDVNNDGPDNDGDGACDDGDPDDDNDTVPDGDDSDPFDDTVCRDADNDQCDDCVSGTDDPANDGPDNEPDGLCDLGDPDDDNDGALDGDDSHPFDPLLCGDTDGDTCEDCIGGTSDPANDGPDVDSDGICDATDTDNDNDLVDDVDDNEPLNPNVCRDVDNDNCDDCTNGTDDVANDGTDTDSDGLCDAGDPDQDNDNVLNGDDSAPLDNTVCRDVDNDNCDDCSSTVDDVANDGTDTDSDGLCDAGDPDQDDDGVLNGDDNAPLDNTVCRDVDNDNCDDCSSGSDNVNDDGTDTDSDGLCDAGDPDQDNDNVLNGDDSAPLDNTVCRDADNDNCDDCSSGTDNVADDGTDTDSDGLCDAGDPDQDDDGVLNGDDNAPLDNTVCRDADNDNCDDCSSGSDNVNDDGTDTDSDGLCDAGDPDQDNDNVLNGDDSA